MMRCPNTAMYFPATYLPAAFGLGVGNLARASPFVTFILARLGMLVAFLLIASLALRQAAFGQALLMGIRLLPTVLFVAGSVNQDGVLVAMLALVMIPGQAAHPFRDDDAPHSDMMAPGVPI
jgi:uncharacterized membrane protein